MTDDDLPNNILVAGAMLAILQQTNFGTLEAVNAVTDADGMPTNQIEVELSFMKSAYRLTVERVR